MAGVVVVVHDVYFVATEAGGAVGPIQDAPLVRHSKLFLFPPFCARYDGLLSFYSEGANHLHLRIALTRGRILLQHGIIVQLGCFMAHLLGCVVSSTEAHSLKALSRVDKANKSLTKYLLCVFLDQQLLKHL